MYLVDSTDYVCRFRENALWPNARSRSRERAVNVPRVGGYVGDVLEVRHRLLRSARSACLEPELSTLMWETECVVHLSHEGTGAVALALVADSSVAQEHVSAGQQANASCSERYDACWDLGPALVAGSKLGTGAWNDWVVQWRGSPTNHQSLDEAN